MCVYIYAHIFVSSVHGGTKNFCERISSAIFRISAKAVDLNNSVASARGNCSSVTDTLISAYQWNCKENNPIWKVLNWADWNIQKMANSFLGEKRVKSFPDKVQCSTETVSLKKKEILLLFFDSIMILNV